MRHLRGRPHQTGQAYIDADEPLSKNMRIYFVCPTSAHWYADAIPLTLALQAYPGLYCLDPEIHRFSVGAPWPQHLVPVTEARMRVLQAVIDREGSA